MSGDPLLVPMHLDAMALSERDVAGAAMQVKAPDYQKLTEFLPPGPEPFAEPGHPPVGIHLHWTLPRPLRHAPEADAGDTWPLVPNRWCVVRVASGKGAAAGVKSWIVCSDAPEGTSPFVTSTDGAELEATSIGVSHEMTPSLTSADLTSSDRPVLKAVGPGNATFANFVPGVRDVFAFYDDLEGAGGDPIAAGTFTYHVTGWYVAPNPDPLAGVKWAAPDEKGLSVDETFGFGAYLGGAAPPSWMLVHAQVADVEWAIDETTPPSTKQPTDVPSQVSVAIGNSAVDALAALLRQKSENGPALAEALEAFAYGELETYDQPNGAIARERAVREHWFGASSGGTRWTVVRPEPSGPTALPTPPEAPLSGGQEEALAALNVAQRKLDRLERLAEGMAESLYSLWFKRGYMANNPVGAMSGDPDERAWFEQQLEAQLTASPTGTAPSCLDRLNALRGEVSTTAAAVKAAKDKLSGLLSPQSQQLKPARLPQYRSANDPVVLITGLGRSTNLDPVGDLTCRLPEEAVDSLSVDGTVHGASEVPQLPDPNDLLPDGVAALHAEAVFLSPVLCAEAVLHDGAKAAAVEAAVEKLPAPSATGSFPPAEGSWGAWAQPWVPLLIDWKIWLTAAPAYAEHDSTVLELQTAMWKFDGTSWSWNGPTTPPSFDFAAPRELSGRTFVTPHLTFSLADRLEAFLKTHEVQDPELEATLKTLEQELDGLRTGDVLSQRLSGLRAQLVQRELSPAPPPEPSIRPALEDMHYPGFPVPLEVPPSPSRSEAAWDFAPLAGTFFTIEGLTAIDFMGRTVDLILANGSTAQPKVGGEPASDWFYPISAPGLAAPTSKSPIPYPGESTDPTQRMAQLLPSPTQGARLCLRATANDGSNADVDLVAGTTPVCGWIVPNHLDRSLAVYAPDGTPWGEVYLSKRKGEYEAGWQPAPIGSAAHQTPCDIPNLYVAAMLTSLLARADAGAAVSDLLLGIDETLWGIEPGGPRKDQDLSVLIGRPLAVVRAELSLQLRGMAACSQDWWNTFAVDWKKHPATQPAPLGAVDGGVSEMLWPVRLGDADLRDDGLVGYFADVEGAGGLDPATWNALAVVRRPADATSGYLRQIGGEAAYPELKFTDDTVTAPEPALRQAQRMTMLVDPRATVHGFTGLLPVASLDLEDRFLRPALRNMSYLFRAGPFLTAPDAVRLPRPAESKGAWSWFDEVLGRSVPIAPADAGARFSSTSPLALEGWLRLEPDDSGNGDKETP